MLKEQEIEEACNYIKSEGFTPFVFDDKDEGVIQIEALCRHGFSAGWDVTLYAPEKDGDEWTSDEGEGGEGCAYCAFLERAAEDGVINNLNVHEVACPKCKEVFPRLSEEQIKQIFEGLQTELVCKCGEIKWLNTKNIKELAIIRVPPFIDDTLQAPQKIGRNTPCPCGSGLKHKKCCSGKS